MGLSREPSLRNWMKWSSSSSSSSNNNNNSNSSNAAPANKEPAEIIHLGGSRLESPLIEIPASFIDERRLTAWPCGPPPAPPTNTQGLSRSNTDGAALGRRPQTNGSDIADSALRSNPTSLQVRPAPGRSQPQQPNVDSFSLMSPPLSATSGYHASFFPQRPQDSDDDRSGDRSPASSISAASSSQFSIKPPPPLRTREALASPLTPATSFASGPRTGPPKTPTDSFYYDQRSPDSMSVISSPGRSVLHVKSPSHSGHFPVRSSSKGPSSQPMHLRRSQSTVDTSRKYQAAAHTSVSPSEVLQEEAEPQWPLSPVPFETVNSQASEESSPTSKRPQIVVVDYPPPSNSPPKKPLPKIITIPATHGAKTQSYNGGLKDGQMRPKTPNSSVPRHTAQERVWLHKNYRGEAAFLKAWGLDIEHEQNRDEGKAILQDLMQAEDDETEGSLLGARLRPQQGSTDWPNNSSTSSLDEAGLHVIEEEDSKSPPPLQVSKHSRSTSGTRKASGPAAMKGRVPPPRGHFKSESETSVLGQYLETWIDK